MIRALGDARARSSDEAAQWPPHKGSQAEVGTSSTSKGLAELATALSLLRFPLAFYRPSYPMATTQSATTGPTDPHASGKKGSSIGTLLQLSIAVESATRFSTGVPHRCSRWQLPLGAIESWTTIFLSDVADQGLPNPRLSDWRARGSSISAEIADQRYGVEHSQFTVTGK